MIAREGKPGKGSCDKEREKNGRETTMNSNKFKLKSNPSSSERPSIIHHSSPFHLRIARILTELTAWTEEPGNCGRYEVKKLTDETN